MNKTNIAGIAIAAVLVAAAAGHLIAPRGGFTPAIQPANVIDAKEAERTARAVLYWKDPDGRNEFSSAPKAADGRDYLPVYDDQEPDLAETKPATPTCKGKIFTIAIRWD
jgi:Cu(I)/Ag(I) efflux system membrane fusion protein